MQREPRRTFYRESLSKMREVAAMFAVSDFYAAELLQFLAESGVAVPEELSVAGFDDIPLCRLVHPALTTVRQDGAQRARLALEMLERLRGGQEVEPLITLPVQLVPRESSGAAR